ncbi:IS630 family transposase [Acidithiobacillus sulfuriphilus]|uniref:IS630 family transposase n=2 Tax=Acidithiobacillus sulfuriphilus TaxID=1867749 RepID=A0ACD5HLM0_9PROT
MTHKPKRTGKKLPEILQETQATFAEQCPIIVLFQDEARFGRINDVRRCWAPKPMRPICQAMLTHEYTYAYAAVDVATGKMDSLILPQVNTSCMQLFLDEVAGRHTQQSIIMIMDGAGWHSSSTLKVPANMRLLSLPPYAPELNPVEHVWDEIREKYFLNRVFDSIGALEDHLEAALRAFENDPERLRSIVSWPWIKNALMI